MPQRQVPLAPAVPAGAYLLSLSATAVLATINHLFSLGPRAAVLGAAIFLAPSVSLYWMRRSGTTAARVGFVLTNAWVVVGFGMFKGLWRGVLPLFLGTLLSRLSTSFPAPTTGPPWSRTN